MLNLDKLTAGLKIREGLRLFPYKDATGNLTIGYGRNLSSRGISNAEAESMLSTDIQSVLVSLSKEPWWPVISGDDVRSRAIAEIEFNIGFTSLQHFTKALAALRIGDFETCAREFEDSQWYDQVGGRPGQRGYILVQMIRTGLDPIEQADT